MIRVAIIDHDTHTLFVEDIDEEILENEYNGEEEEYIKDNYSLSDNWSWDYIIDTEYYYPENQDGVSVEFSDLA